MAKFIAWAQACEKCEPQPREIEADSLTAAEAQANADLDRIRKEVEATGVPAHPGHIFNPTITKIEQAP